MDRQEIIRTLKKIEAGELSPDSLQQYQVSFWQVNGDIAINEVTGQQVDIKNLSKASGKKIYFIEKRAV